MDAEVEANMVLMLDRFHAWQSSLLFSAIFVLHFIFSWSKILSWVIFVGDIFLIGYLTMRAYRDGKSLMKYFGYTADLLLKRIHWTDVKFHSLVSWLAVYWTTSEAQL